MIKRKKNPSIEDILGKIKCEPISCKDNIEVCYLKLLKKKIINNQIILPGEYVIKNYDRYEPIYNADIFIELSNKKLIPYIFVIDAHYIVMEYIPAISLIGFCYDNKHKLSTHKKQAIFENIKKEIKKWHSLGYFHGDLRYGNNILIDPKSFNIIFIDPLIDNRPLKNLTSEQIKSLFERDYIGLKDIEKLIFEDEDDE